MATIERLKLPSGIRWKVSVCVDGERRSKRCKTKAEAREWGRKTEAELSADDPRLIPGVTVSDAMEEYLRKVTPTKRGEKWERVRLQKLQRDPIAQIPCARLRLEHGEALVQRLADSGLKPASIIREVTLLRSVMKYAKLWRYVEHYPFEGLVLPRTTPNRERLWSDFEIELIRTYSGLIDDTGKEIEGFITTKSQEVGLMAMLAIETAMRLGEMTKAKRSHLNWDKAVLFLEPSSTKSGRGRFVPLSPEALRLLAMLPTFPDDQLFSVSSASASTLFGKIRRRARIKDGEHGGITFHDSRHNGVTKLAESLDLIELARAVGHQDPKQLMTYYNKDASDMAMKLRPEVVWPSLASVVDDETLRSL